MMRILIYMKKWIGIVLLLACNNMFAQVREVAVEEFATGFSKITPINGNQLLLVRETGQHENHKLELTLLDKNLKEIAKTILDPVHGRLDGVFIAKETNNIFVVYDVFASGLPLGSDRLTVLNSKLEITHTCHFDLPNPNYSVLEVSDLMGESVFVYGLYMKSSEYFVIELNVTTGKSHYFHDMKQVNYDLSFESFAADNRAFFVYNQERGPADSTFLRVYEKDSRFGQNSKVSPCTDCKLWGKPSFYRIKKDEYCMFGYFSYEKGPGQPEIRGMYVMKIEKDRVIKTIEVPLKSFDLENRHNAALVGLPKGAEQKRRELDSLRQMQKSRSGGVVIQDAAMWKEGKQFFLAAELRNSFDPEGAILIAFDEDLEIKSHTVLPVMGQSRFVNLNIVNPSHGHDKSVFYYSYMISNILSVTLVDSNNKSHAYGLTIPDKRMQGATSLYWYDNYFIVHYDLSRYNTTNEDGIYYVIRKYEIKSK
ncbi:MAG TPA: hypothetical protein VK177_09775 [Flavobacteriales bacterium]|nr:hypothetical protein [Flavobacteriales bacterium]